MPGSTDTRIMELQFENREFERNIAKSTRSLDELKEAMDFEKTSKGLDMFSRGLDKLSFNHLADNIQKLTDKFTGLGTVGELVVSQIRRHIESAAAKISSFVDSMTTQQIGAGMDKFNMLNKSVQTIKAATGQSEEYVYGVLERLNQYTDQTSYNFSDMAQNIGKFTSVGIDLESAERQMEGIANWAARSGAGINEASRAMYNISQAMGVGKLTLIDWKSIENAGMATQEFKQQLIESAVAAGTLEKSVNKEGKTIYKTAKSLGKQEEVTSKNLGTMLNKGFATSQVLSATLEKYYFDDLYYKKQEEAVLKLDEAQKKAFDEMISSNQKLEATEFKTLEEMGVITGDTKQKILDLAASQGKLKKETDSAGNSVYKFTDKNGKAFEITLENMAQTLEGGWFDESLGKAATSVNTLAREAYEAAQKCLTFTDVLQAWKDQISTGWMNSMRLIFGDLSEAMEFFSNVCNRVGESIDFLITMRNNLLKAWVDSGGRNSLIDLILGDYGKDIKTGAVGFLDVIEGIGDTVYKGFVDFMSIFAADDEKHLMRTNSTYFASWMGVQLKNITESAQRFMQGIRNFFSEDIEVNGKVTNRLAIIQDIVRGIAGAMALAYQILSGVATFFSNIGSQLTPGFDTLMSFLGELGLAIFNTAEEENDVQRIMNFFQDLAVKLEPVTTGVNNVVSSLTNFLRVILGLDKEGQTGGSLIQGLADVFTIIGDVVGKIAGPVLNFISKVIDLIAGLFKDGLSVKSFMNFGSDLGTAFGEMMTEFADALPDNLSFLKDIIHGIFGGGKEELEKESTSLFSLIGMTSDKAQKTEKQAKKNTSGDAGLMGLMIGTNAAVFAGVAGLVSLVLLINRARKTVKQIGGFFSGLGESLRNGFKIKFQDESFANKMLKIASSIALLAAAVVVLGSIPINNLIQGVVALGVVMGIFALLFVALRGISQSGSFKNQMALSAQILALSSAVSALGMSAGILAMALIPFAAMSWEGYARSMAGLAGILAMLIGFMVLTSRLHIKTAKLTGFSAFAASLGILVLAIKPFAKMDWAGYARSMAGLAGVLTILVGFSLLMTRLKVKTSQLGGFAAFAASLGILVFAIRPFANMDWAGYARSMAGLGGVLALLVGFMMLTSALPIGTRQLGGFTAFAFSLGLLVLSILPFAGMDWAGYARSMAGLGGVLALLVGFMLLTSYLPIGTAQLGKFIGFALSLAILIQAIMPFAGLDWAGYAKTMAGLGGVLALLVGFMLLTTYLPIGTGNLGGFIMFALSLVVLIQSILPFASMDWAGYARSMAGLGGVLALLVGFMLLTSYLPIGTSQLGGFMAFSAALSVLIKAITPFADMEWSGYAKSMAGLAGVLAILVGFMAIIQNMKLKPKNIISLLLFTGIFTAVVSAFAIALALTKDTKWETIAAFAAGLSTLLVAMAIASNAAKIGGLKGMVILAAGLALIIGVVALLAPVLVGSVMGAIRSAAADLSIIAGLMGNVAREMAGVDEGGFDKANSVIDKMSGTLQKIFSVKSSTGSVRAFMSAMSQMVLAVDEMVKVKTRADALGTDGGTERLTEAIRGYESVFTGPLSNFGSYVGYSQSFYDAIYKLGSAFDYFNTMTATMGDVSDNQGLALIQQLSACAPNLDTIYKMDLDKFRNQLAELGGAMIIYAKGAASVNGGEITDDTDIGGAIILLQKITDSLSKAGGFSIPENMPSEGELTDFGVQLAALAGALVAFEEAGSGLGTGTDKALETITFFKSLKDELLQESFGVDLSGAINAFKNETGEFIKKDELTVFGEDIAQLGSSMKEFASATQYTDEKTGDIKPIDFTKATDALEAIAGLNEKLPRVGGVLRTITGTKQTLTDLSGEIELLGTAIGEFYNSTLKTEDGVPTEQMDFTNAIAFLTSIQSLATTLNTIHIPPVWVANIFSGHEMTFTDLATQLAELGVGMNQLSSAISGTGSDGNQKFDADAATSAMDLLDKTVVPFMTTLGQRLPEIGGIGRSLSRFFSGGEMTLKDVSDQIGYLGDGLGKMGAGLTEGNWGENGDAAANAFGAIDTLLAIMLKLEKLNGISGSAYLNLDKLTYLVNGLASGIEFQGVDEQGFAVFGDTGDIIKKIALFIFALNDEIGQFVDGTDEIGVAMQRLELFKIFTEGLNALIGAGADNPYADWKFIGSKLTSDVAGSITSGTVDVVTAISGMITEAYTAGTTIQDWTGVGTAIATGTAAGITGGTTLVKAAAESMAISAYNAAMAKLRARSPSRVFMDVGSYVGLGMAAGIDSTTSNVVRSVTEMDDSIINASGDAMAAISRAMADNVDANPTISPVLDLTNLQNGMAQFDQSLAGKSISLDPSVSSGLAGRAARSIDNPPAAANQNGINLDGIYERMNAMNEKIATLGQNIMNMKLILDSGVVAGGVTDGVDSNIGRKMFYAGRRN